MCAVQAGALLAGGRVTPLLQGLDAASCLSANTPDGQEASAPDCHIMSCGES